ncbi:DNA polymerase III subunit delta [Pelagibacteraceae bacterium]|nr:DNA polymerase III subunit delta [Pelagibacteraceae bacterium]
MIYKSYLLEQNLEDLNQHKVFLFYGENDGLKKEFKENLKIQNKDYEKLNLFQDEIVKDKNILINEITNKSLFDEKKIIYINQANDKILNILEEIMEKVQDEKIYIFSDLLDKKSKLRNYFEKSKNCGVSPCYNDNEITIKKIIIKKLKEYQGLTPQVINYIIENTGLNRGKVNNEIQKIISCFKDKKIDLKKIELLLNLTTNDDFNELKNEVLKGNKTKANKLLSETIFETENYFFYLNSLNQRINKLREIESLRKQTPNIESIIDSLKPPIFWKEKPILLEQAKKWNEIKLQKAIKSTYATEIEMKSNSSIRKDLLIKNLLVELCSSANASLTN